MFSRLPPQKLGILQYKSENSKIPAIIPTNKIHRILNVASCPHIVTSFPAPVQTYPATYTMGTGPFPEVKRSEGGVDHPPQSSAEIK